MVVESKVKSEHVGDLGNIFGILRKHNLCLNTSKYSFGVGSGKFLGYMVTHRGIEVNPDQIKAINNLRPPQNPKEVQKLTRMTTTLNRFISRSADRCRHLFQFLNKWKGFEWTEECVLAFWQLKEYLSRPPIMSRPEVDEVLFAYIAVTSHAVSLVLIRVDNVVHATRKLLHYFQSHTIVILTQLTLKSLLRSADYTGRIAKWGTILGAFDIKYMPRTAVKGQVADLVAEFAKPSVVEKEDK
ncbi:putative mitochondrial protein AtMg00860 [Castanea sativa]|uniref:putative mitochondrial protein AtMg00860 n=1 Tax=Castanea sativa TaxID=21020 RepID=UPI003F64CB36